MKVALIIKGSTNHLGYLIVEVRVYNWMIR